MPNSFHPKDKRPTIYFKMFGLIRNLTALANCVFYGGNTIMYDELIPAIDEEWKEIKLMLGR